MKHIILAGLHLLFFSLDAVFICQHACECEQKDLDACSISVLKRDCGFMGLISICCPCFLPVKHFVKVCFFVF